MPDLCPITEDLDDEDGAEDPPEIFVEIPEEATEVDSKASTDAANLFFLTSFDHDSDVGKALKYFPIINEFKL